ncbi:putative FBD-associated F-box protein At5g56390 isoform X2 [Euphorbia lathyris]|uniref:putative FBD-associated F-box protein At5g56390 isoform X2 n=1 Tax=Euphorbia lathyris TaxID=212925 RepID=UPI0033137860
MATISGASTVLGMGIEAEGEANERMNCEVKDDLISALPDCLIQHILSFLPSTRDAIRTGILSKRWLNQWTLVPILIFQFHYGSSYENISIFIENISNFIDNALNLYNCSKINKFVIDSEEFFLSEVGPKSDMWIRFAAAKNVKELILDCVPLSYYDLNDEYHELPQFLFNNRSLIKLKTQLCHYTPKKGQVNWASLKALYIVRQPGVPISHLRFSSLEKLVIQLRRKGYFLMKNSVEIEEKLWEVNLHVFDSLMSHLKTVEIAGLVYDSRDGNYNGVLKFIEFILKNARMLEKIVLLESPGRGMDFAHKVCKQLSCIGKSSPHAIVEVACLKSGNFEFEYDLGSDFDWDKIVC